jgi:hypothetical protein
MKLTELQQLNIGELKELAAKEGVTPSGDKRNRITWLVTLEKYFYEKEILSYQPKHYQIKQRKNGECFYRRRNESSRWRRWNGSWLLLKVHIHREDQLIDQIIWGAAFAKFHSDCVPVSPFPRPP